MRDDGLSIRIAKHWFNHFQNGNFEFAELSCSSRPLDLDVDLLSQFMGKDPQLSLRYLVEQLERLNILQYKNI